MQIKQLHGVIAGDIVGSSELPASRRRHLADTLIAAYEEVACAYGQVLPYDIAISAGDEWRLYVKQPDTSLAVGLAFWAELKAREITTRMIVTVDEIDFIDSGNLNNSDGVAFRRAGRGLQAVLGQEWQFVVLLPRGAGELASICAEMTSELIDTLVKDTTAAQARAVGEMIRGRARNDTPTTSEIAERWQPSPISRQAVGKHLRRGGWPVFARALERFERLMEVLNSDKL